MTRENTLELQKHYDALAEKKDTFIQRYNYYYSLLYKQYRYFIPEGKNVLEIGCGTGDLLNALNPKNGYGIDISSAMIKKAKERYPAYNFQVGEINELKADIKFDFIIISGLLGELDDIQSFLKEARRHCLKDTRIVIEYYSYLWQYILKIGEAIGIKTPQRIQNWLSYQDIDNLLKLAGFDSVLKERITIFPLHVPVLSFILNKIIARLPIINALTLNHFIVARPIFKNEEEYSVSIVVPCRNEKGNIEQAVTRTPKFGKMQEFIFVEGGSKDGTYEEVERIIKKYSDKNIKLFKQKGIGKGDAVRLGFSESNGDILMILDADLTVAPEDLIKFYDAIKENKGEFINGCRLVYPMEKEAMRFLNLIANKSFGIFFSWLLGQNFKDTLCGTKVLFRHHYEEIARNRSYFGDFDPFGDFDLIFGAIKHNLKVIELPIRYRSRTYGATQIQRFRHGLLLIRMCFFAMKKIKFK